MTLRLCPFGNARAKWIVRVQDDRPLFADRFRQRSLFRSNRFAAAHEFNMRETDIRDDCDIGSGELRQRGDFSRMIHSDFPNGDFVARAPATSMVCGRPT